MRRRWHPIRRVLHAGDFLTVLAFVGPGNLMPHELLFGQGMLAFAQSREMLIADCT